MVTKNKKAAAQVPKEKAMAKDRETLLETLSAKAKQHVQRVQNWFSRVDQETLVTRYDLGQEIKGLYDDRAKQNGTGHYGLRFVARLCEVYAWDKSTVYTALAFVQAFTRKEITALANKTMANGRVIPYGHLRALAKVSHREYRAKLLKKAIENCWTRTELLDAITELKIGIVHGRTEKDGRGRPLMPPKDLSGLLRQQERPVEQFLLRVTKVWEKEPFSFMGRMKNLSRKEATKDQVQKLKQHAAILRQLVAKAGEQAAEAERAADFLLKKLTTQKGDRAAPAA